jgi:hypothetical protein
MNGINPAWPKRKMSACSGLSVGAAERKAGSNGAEEDGDGLEFMLGLSPNQHNPS